MSVRPPRLPAGDQALTTATAILREGGLVVLPTDTVYGLATALDRPAALRRIFAAKGRAPVKSLPILLADLDALAQVAGEVSPAVMRFVARFWPGPLTVALPARAGLPVEVIGPGETVGVRVPAHDFARRLIAAAGGALAVTSANRSERPAPTIVDDAITDLGGAVDLYVDGGTTPGGQASTVVGFAAGELRIFREGPLSAGALVAAWHEATSN